MTDPHELKRVYWHSRRGMLELDLALMPFAEHEYANLTRADQDIYRRLLESEDTELFSWVLQKERPEDAEFAYMIDKIIAYARQGKN